MNTTARNIGRNLWVACRLLLIFMVVLGVGYPLVLTGIGQLVFSHQANGSLIYDSQGNTAGSSLIGQSFTDPEGNLLPEYFQSRPSMAGDGYAADASAGSNWGPNNADLVAAIKEREGVIRQSEHATSKQIPAEALTASASGLDPHISPAYARLQSPRVAEARGLPLDVVEELVDCHTRGRDLGYLGQPTVNVLELNLALDGLETNR